MTIARAALSVVLAAAALAAAAHVAAQPDGDATRGTALFGQRIACHSIEPGVHLTGPSLARGGSRAGTVEGFTRYSEPLKRAAVVWPVEGRVLQREPREPVERLARVRAGEHRLQEIRARPDVEVRDDHDPRSYQSMRSRSAMGRPARLPAPEPADGNARETLLARRERFLLALGDQERHGRIRKRHPGAHGDVAPGWRPPRW